MSAIIPAYNAEAFVHLAIESALSQTHRLLEVIVVDDGSRDKTAEAASKFPVKVLRKPNGGPASARNAGIRIARGEWIAFLDHDDTWHPTKTARQLAHARNGIDAIFGRKFDHPDDISFEQMFWRNYGGSPSGALIRRDVLLQLEMFDDDPAIVGVEDYNFWLRFLLNGHKFATTEPLHNFTPVETHYSGNPRKMLAAELANLEKIGKLAGLPRETLALRKRALLLEYLPDLIELRHLSEARACLRELGFDRDALKYWVAFAPSWLLDLRRAMKRVARTVAGRFGDRKLDTLR